MNACLPSLLSLIALVAPATLVGALPTTGDVDSMRNCVDRWVPQTYALLENTLGGTGAVVAQNVQALKCRLHRHEPILVDHDLALLEAPLHGISRGSGTPGDPWVIEGWDIVGKDPVCVITAPGMPACPGSIDVEDTAPGLAAEYGITIQYTTQSFLVQKVVIHGFPGRLAVLVRGAQRVTLRDSWTYDADGIAVSGSRDVQLLGNVIDVSTFGDVSFFDSRDVVVHGNQVVGCWWHCVGIMDTHGGRVEGNAFRCQGADRYGVGRFRSGEFPVWGNAVQDCAYEVVDYPPL